MSDTLHVQASIVPPEGRYGRSQSALYPIMAVVLMLIMLVGFAPTFFLWPLFGTGPRSPYVYLHGGLMTSWFVLFFVQASLAYAGNVGAHRKLGPIAATIGYIAVLTAIVATLYSLLNPNPDTDYTDPAVLARRTAIIWGNFGNAFVFAAFLSLAIWFRRRTEIHRRLLLFASINFVTPAVGRISAWPIASGVDLVTFNNSAVLLLVLMVVLYEWLVDRRVSPVTVIAAIVLFAFRITFIVLIPKTELAIELARPVV